MTIDEMLTIVDAVKQNDLSEDLKIHWLNDVEGRVRCEIFKESPKDVERLLTSEGELSVPMPYAKMFLAMISFTSGDYDLYSDLMIKYELDFSEYAKFCLRTR